MKRLAFLIPFLLLCREVPADIVLEAPTETILNNVGAASFTVTAQLTGSYDVAGYDLKLTLTPRDGATGLSFNGANGASSDYLFTVSHDGFAIPPGSNNPTWLYGADTVSWPVPSYETIVDDTRNMVTVNLIVAPGTLGTWGRRVRADVHRPE